MRRKLEHEVTIWIAVLGRPRFHYLSIGIAAVLKKTSDDRTGTIASGNITQQGTKIVGQTKEVGQMMTNMIEDPQIPAYIKVLGKNSPGIEKAFNDALKNGRTNTEAFYKAMTTLKQLKG